MQFLIVFPSKYYCVTEFSDLDVQIKIYSIIVIFKDDRFFNENVLFTVFFCSQQGWPFCLPTFRL